LTAIDEDLREAAGEGWKILTDLKGQEHSQAWLAAHGVPQLKCPDILLVKHAKSGEVQKVAVVELSCVWERELTAEEASDQDEWAKRAREKGAKWTDAAGRRRAAKRQKYEETLMPLLPREWNAKLWTLEVGDRGMVSPETKQAMHSIFRMISGPAARDAKKRAEACLGEARRRTILGSYLIWAHGGRDEWDMVTPIGRWRGEVEPLRMAAKDRQRQRSAEEKAQQEGTWSGGWEKAAANPDEEREKEMAKEEWEAKTATRAKIRAEAEEKGGLCYFPDGSAKDGRSGWGWVAQAGGKEVARAKGPVKLYGEEGWRGAQYHSNNAAELTAVIEVLAHARERASQSDERVAVMVAPDNLWATDVTVGACTGLAHRGLARRARIALELATAQGVVVSWGWVKGHSEHQWNEIADRLADEGRKEVKGAEGGIEEGKSGPKQTRKRQKRTPVLKLEQIVDAQKVREAAESGRRGSAAEARRWLAKLVPRGDGTAAVEVIYTRTNPSARRNAEGVSLQFCSRELRQWIAGGIYVEIDVKGSHPTMLRAQLRRVGVSIQLLDRWVTDRAGCIAEVIEDCRRSGGGNENLPADAEVKDLVLAMLNGASAAKWVREHWGLRSVPATIARFGRDMAQVRARAHILFPQIWEQMSSVKGDWSRRARTIYFAMTSLEDEVLEAMRRKLPELGAKCDALTGDGLLARPAGVEVTPLPQTLRVLEEEVLAETGVQVTLAGKTLDGGSAVQWHRPEPSPWDRGQSEWQQAWNGWQERAHPWDTGGGWWA